MWSERTAFARCPQVSYGCPFESLLQVWATTGLNEEETKARLIEIGEKVSAMCAATLAEVKDHKNSLLTEVQSHPTYLSPPGGGVTQENM